MRRYYDAWLEGNAVAQTLDFDVIFGIEHACDGGEFLCYGIDLPFLLENPDIPELSLDDFVSRAHGYGAVVIQAHPFRWAPPGTALRMDILDGIEVYNAANRPEANQAARACATGICTSGGDIHRAGDERIGKAGIILPYRVRNAAQLAAALKQNHHRLLVDGKTPEP
jgi:predicted metal-dependent phosphoesterase TrpH